MTIIEKATQAIEVLNRNCHSTKLGVIAQQLDLPKSSTHRLLSELVALGIASKKSDGSYSVGYRLVKWGHDADIALGIRPVAEPIMKELSDEIRESVHLHCPDDDHSICVAGVSFPRALQPVVRLGHRLPLGIGASGKLLLAYSDAQVRKRCRKSAIVSSYPDFPDDATLQSLRGSGWATSVGELEPDLTALASIVLTPSGGVLGALTVAGATTRLPLSRYSEIQPLITRVAGRIASVMAARTM